MTGRADSPGRRAVLLALLASVLLVASAAAPGLAADDGFGPSADGPSSADSAYVTDGGDVVLVYEDGRSSPDNSTGHLSANVEENLLHGYLTNPDGADSDVTGEFSALAEPERLTGDGALSFPRPESVRNFELSATGETTADDARTDFDLSAHFENVSGPAAIVRSATTDGSVTVGPDRLQADGNLEVETALPVGGESRLAMTVREDGDAYVLTVERTEDLEGAAAENWTTRSRAMETIRDQFGANETEANGTESDGTVDVAIERYDLTEREDDSARLDTRFTVTYSGVDEALTESLAESFTLGAGPGMGASTWDTAAQDTSARDASANVSSEEARRLAEELLATDLEEASFAFETGSGTYAASFGLDVGGYEDFVLAYYDYLDAVGGDQSAAFGIERASAQFEAVAAADLEQRYTWSGDLTKPESDQMVLDLSFEHRTSNWADYVAELEDRDLPIHDTQYELTGTTDDDRIEVEGSMEFSGDRLFETMTAGFEETDAGTANSGTRAYGPDLSETIDSIAAAEPRKARLSGSVDEDGTRLEFAAEFDNLAALRADLADQAGVQGLQDVTEVVSETDGDTETTYVRVSNAVGADASRSDVRALPAVVDDTAVQTADDHDEEFPTMDVDAATTFLAGDSSGVLGPGFGPVTALVALLAAVLGGSFLAARRR